MSFVNAQPEHLTAAAGNLQSIGSAITAQDAAAAAPTTGVVPPAADEVSA
ncbi:PE family protein, partial [Mycobacterium sp.]